MVSQNGARPQLPVAVDAMGGDFAPAEAVKGALQAQARGIEVLLVGQRRVVEKHLADLGGTAPVVDAPDVIEMHELVAPELRHRQSSLQVAAQLVLSQDAAAVVSCGNSSAIYFVAFSVWGTQPGIDRPAFGQVLMTREGLVFLVDIGANATVKTHNLVQFALMGDVYMRVTYGHAAPRIGLLSNGTEDSKGTRAIKEANQILRKIDINFVGNIEGNQIFEGKVDVAVCDGFTGNVLLKGGEGVAMEIFDLLRAELTRTVVSRLAAAVLRPAFLRVRRHLDYEEYGGAPMLGVNGVMINCHGRSRAKAITNAIVMADRMARDRLVERIGEALHRTDHEMTGRGQRLARALHLRHGDA